MRLTLAALLFATAATTAVAQAPAPPPPPPPAYTLAGPDLPRMLATLADQPATHSGITFDRSMLQFAQGMLQSGGLEPNRAAAALTGIWVDRYQYTQPAFYTPESMAALIEGYRFAGWKHLVNGNQTPANTAQPRAMVTDLWLHYSGADIDGVTVLTRSTRDMNVLRLTGDLRPLDLLHLSGHFGIPKIDPSAVMIPDPNH